MIRRNPTLIAMSDLDVQDVREHVRRKKEAQQQKTSTTNPTMAGDAAGKPVVAPEDAKRKREAMTRDERLGLR